MSNDTAIRIADIIDAIEESAPRSLQESYDNSGVQTGDTSAVCTGVMLAVDPTPDIIAQAQAAGCNLVVTHHPLLFKGLKSITGANPVEQTVIAAIQAGITVYSAHTSLDRARNGISCRMATMLGLTNIEPLEADGADASIGLGAIGSFPHVKSETEFTDLVKSTVGSPVARPTRLTSREIRRVALCGGSGSSLLPLAIAAGAHAMVTSDTRYHDFIDYADRILIVDIGHFESEKCSKSIFRAIITEKFPNFAHLYDATENNPINYM
ncbi:MAG: Nif3-like dinuclear metal center hexameric protein [Paramuribaculum sp.]|nr:Nif3-like dinuclear metal center hexameric protein [Paramuribaculum sp.]